MKRSSRRWGRAAPMPEPATMAGPRRDTFERIIEATLLPDVFVGDDASWEFVRDLEAVREQIRRAIDEPGQEARRAVAWLELFIAGCYEKSEEIDDSSGLFGSFVVTLFCDWIRARQAAGAPAFDTVRMLLSWIERDQYGYCFQIEESAVAVLDAAGLAALEQAVQEPSGSEAAEPVAASERIVFLKAIHRARGDIPAYSQLCASIGGPTPADCETLARMLLAHRQAEDALAWVERGLALAEQPRCWGNESASLLPRLRREILQTLGRSEEALASAWEAYQRAPSTFSYEDLMNFVAKGERAEWHAKALAALDGADLATRIRIFLATREWARLASAVESASRDALASLSHTVTEPAARKLERSHPLLAAKLHAAMAIRILDARKSAYYAAALQNLENARNLLLREGRAAEWRALADELRSAHRRKTSFLPGFDLVDAGRSAREPSFRERARTRWRQQSGAGGQMQW